jgi:hypothetical protein
VDRHNVIHTRDGGTVQANLPAGAVINQVQRVAGGWIIAYLDAIPRFGLVTPDGVLHPIEGFGQDLLGVSPDGTLVAVREARDLVRVYELPSLDTVANLRLDPEAMAKQARRGALHRPRGRAHHSGNLGDGGGPDSVLSRLELRDRERAGRRRSLRWSPRSTRSRSSATTGTYRPTTW